MAEDVDVLRGIDGPRPMPAALRARVEGLLADPAGAVLHDVDGARPMPARARARVEGALVRGRRARLERPRSQGRMLAAAAVALLLVSSITVFREVPEPAPPQQQSEAVAEGDALGGSRGRLTGPFALAPGVPPESARGLHGAFPSWTPPPFATGDGVIAGGTGPSSTLQPLRIGLVDPDPDIDAGFRAYMRLRNENAGPADRRMEAVPFGEPVDVVANLSARPVDAGGRVVLESLWAPDRVLRGDVFGVGGTVDGQARLLADAVFPQPRRGATAAVYRDGTLPVEAIQALEAALRAKGVRVTTVDVGGETVEADAVFLAVSASRAAEVVKGYVEPPPLGFSGMATLADESVLGLLPSGTRIVSPYAFPETEERRTLAGLTKRPMSAELVHGWVLAKTLAVALWQSDPRTPAAVADAVERLQGFTHGFAPPLAFRPGTRSVVPEGILFTVVSGGTLQDGDFLTSRPG